MRFPGCVTVPDRELPDGRRQLYKVRDVEVPG